MRTFACKYLWLEDVHIDLTWNNKTGNGYVVPVHILMTAGTKVCAMRGGRGQVALNVTISYRFKKWANALLFYKVCLSF